MLLRLLLLFTVVPLVELALLLILADHTGWEFTLALVLVTGIVGAALARWQGLRCLRRLQQQVAAGQVPADPLMDGLMILVAAALLVTPGVLTDLVGFGLLTPPVRGMLKGRVRRHWELRFQAFRASAEPPSDARYPPRDRIIDVRVTDPDEDKRGQDMDFEARLTEGKAQWLTFLDHDAAMRRVRIGLTHHPESNATERVLEFREVQAVHSDWSDRDDPCMESLIGAHEEPLESAIQYMLRTEHREIHIMTSVRAFIIVE